MSKFRYSQAFYRSSLRTTAQRPPRSVGNILPVLHRVRRHRSSAVKMRTKRTFIEEFTTREDPSVFLQNLVLRPGRTPTADEIIQRGLLGYARRKVWRSKLFLYMSLM